MLARLFGLVSSDLAIDLGTANYAGLRTAPGRRLGRTLCRGHGHSARGSQSAGCRR